MAASSSMGDTTVKIHGEMIPVHAQIALVESMSAHADSNEILRWLGGFTKAAPTDIYRPRRAGRRWRRSRTSIHDRLGWTTKMPEHGETRSSPGGARCTMKFARDTSRRPQGTDRGIMTLLGMAQGDDEQHAGDGLARNPAVATAVSPHAPPLTASICSSEWTTPRSCSCTPTGSPSLPLDQKILIWHLYRAALAGRDIYYDQRYAHNLEMRDVLEEIVTHSAGSIRRRSTRSSATRSCSG